MTTIEARPQPAASGDSARERVPPLQNGDRLTRPEFERRYNAMPDVNHAELIEGVVYMPSPVYHEDHGRPHFLAVTWLGIYQMNTPGVDGGDNSSLRLDLDNMPQPDAFLMVGEGQTRIRDKCVEGAPELVVEVAASSASYDLHDKMRAYRRNGVQEYVVWRVLERAVDWFVLREGRYERLPAGEDGIYRSDVFPGLWLDAAALIEADLRRVFQIAQEGLGSEAHGEFVARLAGEG